MSSRSKNVGTLGETQVARYFQRNGFPFAQRLTLRGSKDIGDVTLGDGIPVVVEVKAGRAAESASDGQLRLWLDELLAEMENAGELRGEPHYGVLVVKRKAHGAAQVGGWWALTVMDRGEVVRWRLDEFTDRYLSRFSPVVTDPETIRNLMEDSE